MEDKAKFKIKNSYISLENMHFYAFHGVMPQENKVGNDYFISLRMKVSFVDAAQKDDILRTINYADVYEVVKKEMKICSQLIENVCYRIGGSIIDNFDLVEEVEVKLQKSNPPMGADIDFASVEMCFIR